jgi:7-carboxy-7-deazaguanine synthase
MIPINEIFASVDGEVNNCGQGFPTLFIRTQGCNLRCHYCDTKYSWDKLGTPMPVESIFHIVQKSGFKKVTITGGEPLMYTEIFDLCKLLVDYKFKVSVETNGTYKLPNHLDWWKLVDWVVDYKLDLPEQTPESFDKLIPDFFSGWIKFVVGSKADFDKACKVMSYLSASFLKRGCRAHKFALSPMFEKITADQLFFWMVEDRFIYPFLLERTSINTQLHKFIFPKGEKNHTLA